MGKLDRVGEQYRFTYTCGAVLLDGFQPFVGMDDLFAVYQARELFPLFANRVLSPRRSDYSEYLRFCGFDPAAPPDALTLLGVTGGVRQTDMVELFPCPHPDAENRYTSTFFLRDIPWRDETAMERIQRLRQGESLLPSPGGPADGCVCGVRAEEGGALLGYLPRHLAEDAQRVAGQGMLDSMQITVAQPNTGAPLQQRVLCRFRARWPAGLRPCTGEPYQPLREHAAPAQA